MIMEILIGSAGIAALIYAYYAIRVATTIQLVECLQTTIEQVLL